MIYFRHFSVCRKYCSDSVVNATAVGIYWRSRWMSSTVRAGLAMPRVPGDRVGFIFTHFKHLKGRFQPSTSPVFIVFIISLHREEDTIMGQLIRHIHLRCL